MKGIDVYCFGLLAVQFIARWGREEMERAGIVFGSLLDLLRKMTHLDRHKRCSMHDVAEWFKDLQMGSTRSRASLTLRPLESTKEGDGEGDGGHGHGHGGASAGAGVGGGDVPGSSASSRLGGSKRRKAVPFHARFALA
jgi:uncharacterized membrane protein YgcG